MVVKVLSNLEEFKKVIDGDKPVVIDFWATWCGPCKIISPIFEKLSDSVDGAVDFYKVDVDEAQDIAQEVGVRAMPTFAAFHKGSKVKEVVGANPPALQALIDGVKQQSA